MKVQSDLLQSSLQQLISIQCSSKPLDSQMDDIFVGLREMLDIIRSELKNEDIYYFTYRLDRRSKVALLLQSYRQAMSKNYLPPEIDPWSSETIEFWTHVGANPKYHDLAKNWLNEVAALFIYADETGARYDILEYDEAQFAEPAASILAVSDVSFVPYYTKLLGLWDMGHEVSQLDTINAIFDKYGVCPETEELMICRMDVGIGQYGIDNMEHFYPALEERYGDLAQSDFLRRMVLRLHKSEAALYRKGVAKAAKDFERVIKKYPKAKLQVTPQPQLLFYLAEHETLSDSAIRIFKALEKERLSQDANNNPS